MDGGLPSSKKPKISDLRHAIPFCSQSALEAICQYIAIHGLPDKHRRQDIWKETKEFLENAEMSKYGPLLHRNKGIPALNQEKVVLHINFLSLLAGVFYKGGAFTDFLKFHTAQPSSLEAPWRAVVYCDEVHPGNILNSTSRKQWCIYISFLEFKQMLSKENMWFCLAICRSTEVSQLAAGISQVFRLIMEQLFCQNSPDTGILLSSAKGSMRLFFHTWNDIARWASPKTSVVQSTRHWQ